MVRRGGWREARGTSARFLSGNAPSGACTPRSASSSSFQNYQQQPPLPHSQTQYKYIHPSLLRRHFLGRKRHLTTATRLRIRILLHKEPLPHQLILIINNTPLHQIQALLLYRKLHPCICLVHKVVIVEGGVEEEFVFEALAAFAGLDREAEELGEVGELLGGEDVLAGLGEGDLGGDAGVAGDEAREGEH